jgi:hypothetical protein
MGLLRQGVNVQAGKSAAKLDVTGESPDNAAMQAMRDATDQVFCGTIATS